MPITGRCLCGQLSYSIAADPVVAAICHCTNCQRQSGAAYSVNVGVPAAALTLYGAVSTYEDRGDSGNKVLRRFCGHCGSPIVSELEAAPAVVYVKAGTLDDPAIVQPVVEVWCQSRQPWLAAPAERPCFAQTPG